MTLLATLVHHVPGVTVGHAVLSNTFREPVLVAKAATVLDHATGGRFVLGLGAGWFEGEHEPFGLDLPPIGPRIDRLVSAVDTIRALFSAEAAGPPGVTRDDPFFPLRGAVNAPPPLTPGGPPIYLGGQKPRGIALAARAGSGWILPGTHAGNIPYFAEKRDALVAALEAAGRDPAAFDIVGQVATGTLRTPGARRSTLARGLVEAGATHVVLGLPAELARPAWTRWPATASRRSATPSDDRRDPAGVADRRRTSRRSSRSRTRTGRNGRRRSKICIGPTRPTRGRSGSSRNRKAAPSGSRPSAGSGSTHRSTTPTGRRSTSSEGRAGKEPAAGCCTASRRSPPRPARPTSTCRSTSAGRRPRRSSTGAGSRSSSGSRISRLELAGMPRPDPVLPPGVVLTTLAERPDLVARRPRRRDRDLRRHPGRGRADGRRRPGRVPGPGRRPAEHPARRVHASPSTPRPTR